MHSLRTALLVTFLVSMSGCPLFRAPPLAPEIEAKDVGLFGQVLVGQASQRSLDFSVSGRFNVTAVDLGHPAFEWVAPPLPFNYQGGRRKRIVQAQVQFTPDREGSFRGSLDLTTNAATTNFPVTLAGEGVYFINFGDLMILDVRGVGVTMTPTGIDFGEVTVKTTRSAAIQVVNVGAEHTVDLAVEGSGFAIQNRSITLARQETAWVVVTFRPTMQESYVGFLNGSAGRRSYGMIGSVLRGGREGSSRRG